MKAAPKATGDLPYSYSTPETWLLHSTPKACSQVRTLRACLRWGTALRTCLGGWMHALLGEARVEEAQEFWEGPDGVDGGPQRLGHGHRLGPCRGTGNVVRANMDATDDKQPTRNRRRKRSQKKKLHVSRRGASENGTSAAHLRRPHRSTPRRCIRQAQPAVPARWAPARQWMRTFRPAPSSPSTKAKSGAKYAPVCAVVGFEGRVRRHEPMGNFR